MKQRLLSLMAIACAMFTSTSALAGVDAPTKPVKPTPPNYPVESEAWVAPVAGGTYYIYNVGTGQFLGCGLDWGTRAVATTEGLVKLTDSNITTSGNNNHIIPFTLEEATAYTKEGTVSLFYIKHLKTNKSTTFLSHEKDNSWIDYDSGKAESSDEAGGTALLGYWKIQANGDAYLICTTNGSKQVKKDEKDDPVLAEDGEHYLYDLVFTNLYGVDARLKNQATDYTWCSKTLGDGNYVEWKFIDAENPDAVTAIISDADAKSAYEAALEGDYKDLMAEYDAQMEIYEARLVLMATIAEAEAAKIEDVNAAIAVYNNPEATLADLQKQDSHLKAEMAGLKYKDIDEFNTASEDNPQDVTEYVLINPDFEQDYVQWKSYTEVEGWDITIEANNRCLQETAGTVNEELGYVKIDHFLEAWRDKALSDGTISQTIYGLPAGKYMLECDAFTGQGTKTFEGIYIFIQSENGIEKKPMNTPDGQPMHFSVAYLNEGSDFLTFGLMAESTNANWIGCDNFKLTFYGATTKTQAQLDLEAAIATAEAYQETLSDKFFSEAVRKAFGDAISDAQDLVDDGTDDQCIAAKQNIEAQTSAVQNSIDAYAVLLKYLDLSDGGTGLLDKYYQTADGCGMTELAEKWDTWRNDWPDAYQYGEFSDDEIYELTSSIYTDLKAAWEDVNVDDLTVGTDLTVLIQNYDFSKGQYGRSPDENTTYTGDENSIPGWTVTSGDITELSGSFHNIEAYHKAFDFNQTMKNMPKGVYNLGVQGFVRVESGSNTMKLYGGITKNKIKELSEEYSETPLFGDGNNTAWPYDSKDDNGYHPNSMEGANYYFQETNPLTEKPFYLNTVKIIHKGGDLTIGVSCESTNMWILWDNFSLTYLGQDANVYDEMLQDKLKELDKVCDPDKIIITTGGQQKVDDLKDEIKTKEGTLDADTEAEYEDKIDALINYLNEGHKLAISLRDDLSDYDELRLQSSELVSDDNHHFIEWVSNLLPKFPVDDYGMLEDDDEMKDNEALQATAIDMNRRMADYVMQFAAANPYDEELGTMYGNATEAIFNPRYVVYDENLTTQTTKGWTLEVADTLQGKAIGLETYNLAEMYDCSNFKISQTIRGLYPGWYLLTVDGFYRPGMPETIKTAEDMQKKYVVMFAESGDLKDEKPLKNIMEGAQPNQISSQEVKVTVDEKEYWIPNRMVSAADYLHKEVGHFVDEEEVLNDIAVHFENFDGVFNSIYRNGMLVQVDESGELTIGLRKDDQWVDRDWTIFGNWTLTYFGEETNIPTAVETVEAKSAKNMIKDIFTIDGRQAQRLQRGINIVRTTDGKLHKVLVK